MVGDYALSARLGVGGMGVVYAAESASGRVVALKVVHEQFAQDEEFRSRFRREVAAARRVSGAFTAAVVDADPGADRPWMATSYISGPTLAQRVESEGPLDGAELRRLAIGLVEALREIHRAGVVHRDFKPSNIVLSGEGPRVIDFGISRAADHQALTRTGRVMGTPPFMSPEQFTAPQEVTSASDVFSLAAVLVYAATGRGPFDADTPFTTAYRVVHEEPELSGALPPLRSALEPGLVKDPRQRAGLEEMLALLRRLPDAPEPQGPGTVGGNESAATAPLPLGRIFSALRRGGPGAARRRLLAGLVASAVVGAGVVLAVSLPSDGTARGSGAEPSPAQARGPGVQQAGALPEGFRNWATSLPKSYGAPENPHCLPHGDSLYCATDALLASRIGLADGRIRWQEEYRARRSESSEVVAVTDRTVVARRAGGGPSGDAEPRLVGLDQGSRSTRWSAAISSDSYAVASGNVILATLPDSATLVARDADSGRTLWTFRPPGRNRVCRPLSAGSRPYALCESDALPTRTDIYAFDGSGDGRRILTNGPELEFAGADGEFLVFLHVASENGSYAKALSLHTGTGRARTFPVAQPGMSAFSVDGGRLYFSRPDGRIAALSARDGRTLWTSTVSRDGLSAPVTVGGLVLAATANGQVLGLDGRDGRELWVSRRHGTNGGWFSKPGKPLAVGRAVAGVAAGPVVFAFDAARPPKD